MTDEALPAPLPPPFADGQVVTVFRSLPRPGIADDYGPLADAVLSTAQSQPGFVDFATFSAPDGQRVSIVTFASQQTHDAWRDDQAHRAAQVRGRDEFYEWYSIQVSMCSSTSRWSLPAP